MRFKRWCTCGDIFFLRNAKTNDVQIAVKEQPYNTFNYCHIAVKHTDTSPNCYGHCCCHTDTVYVLLAYCIMLYCVSLIVRHLEYITYRTYTSIVPGCVQILWAHATTTTTPEVSQKFSRAVRWMCKMCHFLYMKGMLYFFCVCGKGRDGKEPPPPYGMILKPETR